MHNTALLVHSTDMVVKTLEFCDSGRSVASKEGQQLVKELKNQFINDPLYANRMKSDLIKVYADKINMLCNQYECPTQTKNNLVQ